MTEKRKAPPPPGRAPAPPPPAAEASKSSLRLDKKSWDKKAVMAFICEHTAFSSMSIASILKLGEDTFGEFPRYTAVREWISEDPEIANLYARAKEDQADYMAEEILDIADDGRNDYMIKISKKTGAEFQAVDNEAIQRSKLRVETRKWLASKLRPKRYADRIHNEHSGGVSVGPLEAVEKQLESNPDLADELADKLTDG